MSINEAVKRHGWRTPFLALARLHRIIRQQAVKARVLWCSLCTAGTKGSNLSIGERVKITPGCEIILGDRALIGNDCYLEVSIVPKAIVAVGSDTWISHDCHICSYGRISIGSFVLIGEFVSIRDTSHCYCDTGKPIRLQGDKVGTICIEDDVWIGRGSAILGRPEGLTIGKGAIIAANTVVNRSIPSLEVWGGTPCRFIKKRDSHPIE